jgi:hypothetical protein
MPPSGRAASDRIDAAHDVLAQIEVRYWHVADIQTTGWEVWFRPKSGYACWLKGHTTFTTL